MAHYDTGKMRDCAAAIERELTSAYLPAKNDIDTLVNGLQGYFQDEVSTNFRTKYNLEAKVSAENLMNLMKQYASLLNQTAEQYDKVITTGLQGLS